MRGINGAARMFMRRKRDVHRILDRGFLDLGISGRLRFFGNREKAAVCFGYGCGPQGFFERGLRRFPCRRGGRR